MEKEILALAVRRRERTRVAIIDSDASVRAMARLHLSSGGYEVVEAHDAIGGRHLVVRTAPNLIVCDVKLPYMSGYELVAELRTDPITQDIPVIFLSTVGAMSDHARRLGAVGFLKKPFMPDRLLEVVGLFVHPIVGLPVPTRTQAARLREAAH